MMRKMTATLLSISALLFFATCGAGQSTAYDDAPFTLAPRDWENFDWEWEQFANTRDPLYLLNCTPHGYLAVQYIRFMNDHLYSRKPFSYREKETAAWLIDELLAMGHRWENIQVQEFPIGTQDRWWRLTNLAIWRSDFPLRRTTQLSQNVILTVGGQSERMIIVGAHYDSYPTPGASDNASGVSLLLESAQRVLSMDNYYTIVYVFFGGEEIGLNGSSYFAGNLTNEQANNIVLMINADNLFDGHDIFYGAAIQTNGLPDTNDLTHRIDALAYELNLGLIGNPDVAFLYSDQLPFLMRGHTVIAFAGLFRTEHLAVPGFFQMDDYMFMRTVSHTSVDCFHHLEEVWPGLIERNMRAFSIFLHEILLIRTSAEGHG